ncbi:MAG: hypothetical protein ABIZ69_14295 [Ilumatobacteraceae bacterium]
MALGHLDAHSAGLGLEHDLGIRDRARAVVSVDGGTVAAMGRGALMSSDELVTSPILFCSGN